MMRLNTFWCLQIKITWKMELRSNASFGMCTCEAAKNLWGDAGALGVFVIFTSLSSGVLSPLIHLKLTLGPGWGLADEVKLRASLFPDKTGIKYLLVLIACINQKWLYWNRSVKWFGFPDSSLQYGNGHPDQDQSLSVLDVVQVCSGGHANSWLIFCEFWLHAVNVCTQKNWIKKKS